MKLVTTLTAKRGLIKTTIKITTNQARARFESHETRRSHDVKVDKAYAVLAESHHVKDIRLS